MIANKEASPSFIELGWLVRCVFSIRRHQHQTPSFFIYSISTCPLYIDRVSSTLQPTIECYNLITSNAHFVHIRRMLLVCVSIFFRVTFSCVIECYHALNYLDVLVKVLCYAIPTHNPKMKQTKREESKNNPRRRRRRRREKIIVHCGMVTALCSHTHNVTAQVEK